MARDPSFEVVVDDGAAIDGPVVLGVADAGVAGLTAVDYLTSRAEADQVGHVRAHNLPDVAPFSEGRPRHPVRLYDLGAVTVCVSELSVPVPVADTFTDALFEWLGTVDAAELAVLYGATYPHSEDQHVVSHVATDGYRTKHFDGADTGIDPLSGGFFDGIVGECMIRGLDEETPPVGALVTPAHPPSVDFEAAIRLVETFGTLYDVAVDTDELRGRSEAVKEYYHGLAERMEASRGAEGRSRDVPEDRMYM